MSEQRPCDREASTDPPFPPHDPNYPDVSPITGDERITTDEDGNPL